MSVGFTSIPTIDLEEATSPEGRPRVLQGLRHALLNVGFLYVRNHGVPEKTIRDLVGALPVLFNLTQEEKEVVALHNSPHFLGYSGTGAEMTAGKLDGREQFEFATELEDDWVEGKPLAERLKGPNQASITEAQISNSARILTSRSVASSLPVTASCG